jgi:hypothetical protein
MPCDGDQAHSEPNALTKGNNPMLAPLIIDPLIASLLLLAVGWVIDILHASTHDRQGCLESTGPIGWKQINRPHACASRG